jgi:hypothetical protein
MSAAAHHVPMVSSPVLLVVAGGTVSQAAISRTAELAAGAPVTVIGVGSGHVSGTNSASSPGSTSSGRSGGPAGSGSSGGVAGPEPEQVRRAVALAMSVLENTGVMALGHIAVTGSPARTVARVARARGVRVVVLDHPGGLAAELRRRMYGSGIVVVSATERGSRSSRWEVPS